MPLTDTEQRAIRNALVAYRDRGHVIDAIFVDWASGEPKFTVWQKPSAVPQKSFAERVVA